ncbi:MAG TPA: hypothetical protein VFB80_05935 [Pirellulaceae bacterium]|nr:hypothetical protein [Pirellulaceae bacterium]
MSTTITVRRPRRKRPPSARDQALASAYLLQGKSQAELAAEWGLTQARVSQIVRRVRAWRSQLSTQEQRAHQELYETVYRTAMRKLLHEEQGRTVTTVKTGPRGIETTVRELPPTVKWLKVAQRAAVQLSQPPDGEAPIEPDPQQRQRIMVQELVKLRDQAERAGRLPARGRSFPLVVSLLRALQGLAPYRGEDDQGLVELGQRLLGIPPCESPDVQPPRAASEGR